MNANWIGIAIGAVVLLLSILLIWRRRQVARIQANQRNCRGFPEEPKAVADKVLCIC
jgi:LPXTG-motif cell wall-anchored protein